MSLSSVRARKEPPERISGDWKRTAVTKRDSTTQGIITGDIEHLGFTEIVQTMSLGEKTGRVTFTHGDSTGRIWFEKGAPKHALADNLEGELAFFEMISWESGNFVIETGVQIDRRSLTKDATYLLIEGLRRMDEANRDKNEAAGSVKDSPAQETPKKHSWIWGSLSIVFVLVVASLVGMVWSPPDGILTPPVAADGLPGAQVPQLAEGSSAPSGPGVMPEIVVTELDDDFLYAAAIHEIESQWPAEPEVVIPALDKEHAPPDVDSETGEDLTGAISPAGSQREQVAELVQEEEPVAVTVPTEQESLTAGIPEVETASENAYLEIQAESSVKKGLLRIDVDGEEVFSRRLRSDGSGPRRFFRRMVGRPSESFGTIVTLPPGEHELLAQVEIEGKSYGYQASLSVDVQPGVLHQVRLVAGRKVGRPLTLKLGESIDAPEPEAEPLAEPVPVPPVAKVPPEPDPESGPKPSLLF
jgi:hypothetical protein